MIIDITLFILRFIFELSFHRFELFFEILSKSIGIEINFRMTNMPLVYIISIIWNKHYYPLVYLKRKIKKARK